MVIIKHVADKFEGQLQDIKNQILAKIQEVFILKSPDNETLELTTNFVLEFMKDNMYCSCPIIAINKTEVMLDYGLFNRESIDVKSLEPQQLVIVLRALEFHHD